MGPGLDGIGERPATEILSEIVDPNRSLESNYRYWMVFTVENDVFTGRLLTETRTSLELIDSGDVRHVVQREDIDLMRPSKKSAMPEGLVDDLPAEDLRALLTFLSRSKPPAKAPR